MNEVKTVNENSVKTKILRHLQSGKPITPLQALKDYNCMSLAQRVAELKEEGYPIEGKLVKDDRTKKHFAQYIMLQQASLS